MTSKEKLALFGKYVRKKKTPLISKKGKSLKKTI
jgi:inhibitor of KinA sporulation pathway (predicted exonuclease)